MGALSVLRLMASRHLPHQATVLAELFLEMLQRDFGYRTTTCVPRRHWIFFWFPLELCLCNVCCGYRWGWPVSSGPFSCMAIPLRVPI